jgi:hypothetical protein
MPSPEATVILFHAGLLADPFAPSVEVQPRNPTDDTRPWMRIPDREVSQVMQQRHIERHDQDILAIRRKLGGLCSQGK